jgi:RNA polymerase-binding transcription factor DksA
MNTAQKRLEQMREDLRRDLASDVALLARSLEDKGEDTSVSQHPADVASDLYAREELVAEEVALALQLEQIEDALRGIADGRYGKCVECGGAISVERLAARPQATRCITCQRKLDR